MTDCKVSIFSEFQKLEEVIVGRAHAPEAFEYSDDPELRDGLGRILQETEEDLQKLCLLLEDMGVTVRRPDLQFELGKDNKPRKVDLNLFDFTFPNHPLMPRDTVIVSGNRLIQTYTKSLNRYFENWAYYKLFMEYYNSGAEWVSMPAPFLEINPETYEGFENSKLLFHAANVVKCGKDIFYSQPGYGEYAKKGKGTEVGRDWVIDTLGKEFRIHPAPCAGHLDGKIALVRPGVVVAWSPDHVPEKLKDWEIVTVDSPSPFPEHFQKIKKQRFYREFVTEWLSEWIGYVDETVFDVNMFSVSEDVVITNGYNERVFRKLKEFGVEAIPWNFRHQYFWDGAIHCVTLDIRRSGGLEDYFA